MILVPTGKVLSLQDLLDNAVSRLGIKQFAGGIGLHKLIDGAAARFETPAAFSPFSPLETICIIPLRSFHFPEVVQFFSPLTTSFSSEVDNRASTCIALAGVDQIPEFMIHRSRNSGILLFSSIYDEFHLESRLIGLIREKTQRQTTISGGLLNLDGVGVVITGESGLGKTSCALELIKRGHRWVADDVVVLEKKGKAELYGRSFDFKSPLLEIKGRGIIRAEEVIEPSSIMSESRIDCMIELVEEEEREKRNKQGNTVRILNIMGFHLPCVTMPASRRASQMALEVEYCIRTLQLQARGD